MKSFFFKFLLYFYEITYKWYFKQQEFNRRYDFYGNGHNGSYIYFDRKNRSYIEI